MSSEFLASAPVIGHVTPVGDALAHCPEVVAILDAEGGFQFANAAAVRLLVGVRHHHLHATPSV